MSINRRTFLRAAAIAAGIAPLAARLPARSAGGLPAPRPGSGLPFYEPSVKTGAIYFMHPGQKPRLNYNHDVDVVRFKGRFLAAWNANWVDSGKKENIRNQLNYLSTSDDFEQWSAPVTPFTSAGGATNPIDLDNQWQPCFVNLHDEELFCAWCTFTHRRLFVSRSRDGVHWTNMEVPVAPPELRGRVVGFPTAHGLLTSKDVMMIPCSLPFCGDWEAEGGRASNLRVGSTQYAGVLLSRDRGRTWEWSEPIEAATWSEIGESPAEFGGETAYLWEPVVYETAAGGIGLLIRNSTAQDAAERMEKPHRMIFAAHSEDGRRWSKARPIEVESICSRILALSRTQATDDLHMVMNDWHVRIPDRISFDRYFLALFCAPVTDPDLLLPGPVVQPPGGRAYYPNGFVHANTLYLGYSYASQIRWSIVSPMPDYSRPFLLPRAGRAGLQIDGRLATFFHRYSSLGLVLTAALTKQPRLRLAFRSRVNHYDGRPFPLLTLGGKTRAGTELRTVFDEKTGVDMLQVKAEKGRWETVAPYVLGQWNQIAVELDAGGFSVSVNATSSRRIETPLLRKICFGGLYEKPEWPMGMAQASNLQLDLDSIEVG